MQTPASLHHEYVSDRYVILISTSDLYTSYRLLWILIINCTDLDEFNRQISNSVEGVIRQAAFEQTHQMCDHFVFNELKGTITDMELQIIGLGLSYTEHRTSPEPCIGEIIAHQCRGIMLCWMLTMCSNNHGYNMHAIICCTIPLGPERDNLNDLISRTSLLQLESVFTDLNITSQ